MILEIKEVTMNEKLMALRCAFIHKKYNEF
jgi:hypothetical protein